MVGSMIVAYIAETTVAAFTFAQTAAAFAINFAVSQIVTRVFGQDQQGPQDNGVRQQVPPSSTNAMPVAYGDVYMGGTFVDAVISTDQKTMYYVIAVSSISPNGQFTYNPSKFYFGDRLVTFAASGTVVAVEISNGGSGYAVGNVLTVSGGTPATAAQLTVTSVSSGVITGVTISNAGSYTSGTTPNNPASVTSATGTGAKFIVQYSSYQPKVQALADEAGNIDTKISDNLFINLYRSSAAGAIVSLNNASAPRIVMGGTDIASAQRWPSTNRQMNGLAFAIVKLIYNQDAGTTNLSPITFNFSHYLNNAGCARPGDVWYDYITNTVYGGAIPTAFVDATSAATLNTYSDELITFDNSSGVASTQPRYRMNGVLDAGQTVLTNIDKIMSCCDSWMTYNAASGQWSVVVNKAETAAFAFDDDNIIGEIRVSATDITSSINQVEAKFPFKDNRDQPSFVQLATPSGQLYPNEPVNKYSITYDLVNDSVQASYLANRLLEQAREDLIVSFSTTYYGIQVDAGSVISVTNSAYGWTNKLFRVMKVNEASLPDGSLGAKLELSEYSATVYNDSSITEFTAATTSNIPSVTYFSELVAPTITGYPSATVPYFDVTVTIPTTGRVTTGSLFYTTTPTPSSTDWKLLDVAQSSNSQPVVNGSTYTFTNQILSSATYYFAYTVGNEIGNSGLSPLSTAFVWGPVGMTGPRSSSGYIYYATSSLTAPAAPTASGYNYATGSFTTLTAGWSTTFTAPDPVTNPATQDGSKFWAVRYNVSEATFGGTQTVTLSAVFNWQNLDGLVTFTNVSSPSGTTFIDGGNITADTLSVNKIKNNSSGTFNTSGSFGLGVGSSIGGYLAAGVFTSTSSSLYSLLAANTSGFNSIGSGTTNSTSGAGAAVVGVGAGNSTFSTYKNQGLLGTGTAGGEFQTAGSGNLGTPTADIRLAYYNGSTSYASYIVSGATFPFTAGHDALQLLTEAIPEVGDLMVDVNLIAAPTVNDCITQMTLSSSANQNGVVGVFVGVAGNQFVPAALGEYTENTDGTNTLFVMKPEFANIYDTYRPIGINAIGEGKVNVCGQGGDIAIGDLICASDTAGKGMKQGDDLYHSYTVAKSRQAVTFSSPDEVVQIACIYVSG